MNALRCRKEHCNGAVIGLPARCCTCGATVSTIEGGDDVIAYVEKLQSSVAAACKTGQLLVAEQHVRELEELLHPYNRHFAQILDAVAHAFAEGLDSVSPACTAWHQNLSASVLSILAVLSQTLRLFDSGALYGGSGAGSTLTGGAAAALSTPECAASTRDGEACSAACAYRAAPRCPAAPALQ